MANPKHVAILKRGIDAWNNWRAKNAHLSIYLSGADLNRVDLSRADLSRADLGGANLREANCSGANLREANLSGTYLSKANLFRANFFRTNLFEANLCEANLREADLREANCNGADLSRAYLREADLRGANLREANLRDANCTRADLSRADLSRADLREADLREADLRDANLRDANLSQLSFGETIFSNVDLITAIGLDEARHYSPSTIGIDTLQRSKGKIPVKFLRGCGLSDFEIESAKLYDPNLSNQEINDILYKIYDLRARQSIQISPLFISYSRKDDAFVDKLEIELNNRGIRFWRDIHDAKAGRLETQIEQAIRQNPTLLLVLSKSALESDWVQHEVRKARGLEKELGRDVLCPVTLDDGWRSSRWPERVMEQVMEYNILDFSQWQDDAVFQRMFVKLLDGLQLFYKK